MKKLKFIILIFSINLYADYLMHPKTEALIDELVNEHGFERDYVSEVLASAERKQKIIDSISNLLNLPGLGIDTESYLLKIRE